MDRKSKGLSPPCVCGWLSSGSTLTLQTHTHTHTLDSCVKGERGPEKSKDRALDERVRVCSSVPSSIFIKIFVPGSFLSLVWFFSCCLREGGSTTSDRYIIGIARNQCEWNQQPASQPEQSRFLFLSVLLLLLLLLCVKMLENNFGNRIWLSRACEGWDGAYFNLVETTKCGGVRNGKKEKNKQQEKSWKEKWRKRRRSFIDWHVDRYGDDFYFWTDFTSIHFQFPLFLQLLVKDFWEQQQQQQLVLSLKICFGFSCFVRITTGSRRPFSTSSPNVSIPFH